MSNYELDLKEVVCFEVRGCDGKLCCNSWIYAITKDGKRKMVSTIDGIKDE